MSEEMIKKAAQTHWEARSVTPWGAIPERFQQMEEALAKPWLATLEPLIREQIAKDIVELTDKSGAVGSATFNEAVQRSAMRALWGRRDGDHHE